MAGISVPVSEGPASVKASAAGLLGPMDRDRRAFSPGKTAAPAPDVVDCSVGSIEAQSSARSVSREGWVTLFYVTRGERYSPSLFASMSSLYNRDIKIQPTTNIIVRIKCHLW